MREAIKRIVLRMFPELAGGYHLDRYARIVRIPDPPAGGETCDRFRPLFAADIEIITPDGVATDGFPIFEAVPLPVPAAGNNAGVFHWPRVGTIVTVRWIEGRPDHPVIQHVYPMGLVLPAVPDTMGRWQQADGVHQTVDPAGNWERKTSQAIKDIADTISETATGDRSETVGGNSSESVTGNKTTSASAYHVTASKVSIGAPTGPSVLPEITGALNAIKEALDILATHTHPEATQSADAGNIQAKSSSVGAASTALQTLQ